MILSPALIVCLLLAYVPLQIKPEFVVEELEACCHHQIYLKCKHSEKIAIIQSRYVVTASVPKANPYTTSHISKESKRLESSSLKSLTHQTPPHLSLWDMDVKFSHDLSHSKRNRKNDYSSLNTPEWAVHRQEESERKRYTTPNPLLNGLKFTAQRTLEIPPYEGMILDKETIWSQPLFPLNTSRNVSSKNILNGRIPNVRNADMRTRAPLPCLSYEALAEVMDDSARYPFPGSRKLPRPQWHYKDLRPVFNRRCSGKSECSFNLLRNKLKDQDLTSVCQKWPDGRILVKYLCFNPFAGDVHSKCNVDLESVDEGLILSPGYPEIYHGDNPCQWRLHLSQPEQKILLLFLDISLRGEEKLKCRDRIVVTEGSTKMLSTCGEESSAIGILSLSSSLNVTFIPESRLAFPKRGFLLYFRTVGCGSPESLPNAYLSFRNGSHALVLCEAGYIFNDTLLHFRWLLCNSMRQTWDNGFIRCQETGQNLRMEDPEDELLWPSTTQIYSTGIMMTEIGIPIIVLGTLFLLNTLIVLWIWTQLKRRQAIADIQNDLNQEIEGSPATATHEDSTFTLSSGGFEQAQLIEGGDCPRHWITQQNSFRLQEMISTEPSSHEKDPRPESAIEGFGGIQRSGYSLLSSNINEFEHTSPFRLKPSVEKPLSEFKGPYRLPRSTPV